jgi:hypothetical protein
MDAATLLRWDRHVVTCGCCRAAVEGERRVLAALRSPTSSPVPRDLRGMLLAMASQPAGPETGSSSRSAHVVPPVPVAPVRVVDRGAPALHRSARRATVYAGLAAGATAAAAWSLVISGGALTSPSPTVSPAVQRAKPVSPGFATAAFTVPGLGSASSATTMTPAVGSWRGRSAQSTP